MTNSVQSRTNACGIFTVVRWMSDYKMFLEHGSDEPSPFMLLSGWGIDAEVTGSIIALTIDGNHRPRVFDPPIVAFLRLAIAFSGSIALNPVGSSEKGDRRLYPMIRAYAGKEPASRRSIKSAIYIDRLTKDAQSGTVVKELTEDFRDRRGANLITEMAQDDRRRRFLIGREEAIDLLTSAYDFKFPNQKRQFITKGDYEYFLRMALYLQDMQNERLK